MSFESFKIFVTLSQCCTVCDKWRICLRRVIFLAPNILLNFTSVFKSSNVHAAETPLFLWLSDGYCLSCFQKQGYREKYCSDCHWSVLRHLSAPLSENRRCWEMANKFFVLSEAKPTRRFLFMYCMIITFFCNQNLTFWDVQIVQKFLKWGHNLQSESQFRWSWTHILSWWAWVQNDTAKALSYKYLHFYYFYWFHKPLKKHLVLKYDSCFLCSSSVYEYWIGFCQFDCFTNTDLTKPLIIQH